jgi:hypothetical protein
MQVTSEEFADLCNTIAIKFQKEPPVCWLLQLLIILCLSRVMKSVLICGRGLIQCQTFVLCTSTSYNTVKDIWTHSFMKSYSYYKSIIFQGLYLYLQCINDSAVMLNEKGASRVWFDALFQLLTILPAFLKKTNNNALGFVYLIFWESRKALTVSNN